MSVARQWQIAAVVDIETEGYNYKYIWNGQNYIYYFGCSPFFFFCILSIYGEGYSMLYYTKNACQTAILIFENGVIFTNMSEKFLFWQWKNQPSYNFRFICGSFCVRIISYYHRLENFMEFFNEILREKNGIGWEISFTPTSNPQSTCMPGRIRNMKGKICILVGILYRTVEENLNLTTCFDMLYTYISIVLMYSTFA